MTFREMAEKDDYFKRCCDAAEIKSTKRQASKFRRGMGKAFKIGKPIVVDEIKLESESKPPVSEEIQPESGTPTVNE